MSTVAQPLRPSRSTTKAAIIGFWAALLFFAVAYAGAVLYTRMPIPMRLVVGTSMEPTLHAGDVVVLKSTPFSRLRRGDLVAYQSPDAESARAEGRPDTILHRVIDMDQERGALITKGDNSIVDPWPITSDIVLGKQVLRIPAVGRPILVLADAKKLLLTSVLLTGSLLASAMLAYRTAPGKLLELVRKNRPVSD